MSYKISLWKLGMILVAAATLSACLSVLPAPKHADTIYRLAIPDDSVRTPVAQTQVINIEFPKAPKALSGTDIVLSPDGRRLSAAANAHWSETIPVQARNLLIDILAQQGRFTGIIPSGATYVPYRLNMDIRRFEAVFDQGEDSAPLAMVHISFTLTDTNTRALIGSYSAHSSVRSTARSVSSIVSAQDEAARSAMQKASNWLEGQLPGKT